MVWNKCQELGMRDFTNIGFERKHDNNNLYIKLEKGKDILISKIFVDDIISRWKDGLCKDFVDQMKHEIEMSMSREIKFFFGLQVYQLKHGIFVTQSKCIKEILKIFGFEESKLVSTLMIIGHKLSKNDESTKVN